MQSALMDRPYWHEWNFFFKESFRPVETSPSAGPKNAHLAELHAAGLIRRYRASCVRCPNPLD
jgi:hypothetical protein